MNPSVLLSLKPLTAQEHKSQSFSQRCLRFIQLWSFARFSIERTEKWCSADNGNSLFTSHSQWGGGQRQQHICFGCWYVEMISYTGTLLYCHMGWTEVPTPSQHNLHPRALIRTTCEPQSFTPVLQHRRVDPLYLTPYGRDCVDLPQSTQVFSRQMEANKCRKMGCITYEASILTRSFGHIRNIKGSV